MFQSRKGRVSVRDYPAVGRETLTLVAVVTLFAIAGMIFVMMSKATTTPQPLGVAGNWNLAWSDEFSGTTLDMTKWNVMESWHAPPGAKFSDADTWCPLPMPSNFNVVSNGTLKMNLFNQPAGGQPTQACELNTRNHFENFTEGYIEARIKNPGGADLWTGYWLMGNGTGTNGWPKTGEVDIFEFVNNGKGHGTPFFSVHYAGPCDQWNHCAHTQGNPWPSPISTYASQFHTYGLKRTVSGLEVYIDGMFKYKFTPDMKNAQGQQLPAYLFNGPMHAILTIKSGGHWGNDPLKAPEAGTFEVDYIRAWSIGTSTGTGDTTAPTAAITAPAAGAIISGTTKVTASASDAVGVTRTELFIDGVQKATDTTAPYEFALDTTTITNGTRTLQVKAYDAAGNIGSSAVVSVNVSNPKISQSGNIATGKTFTSNVGTINSTTLGMINNQNETDRWISANQDNVTVGTDLGAAYTLSKVSILWAGDTTRNYDLQMSADNTTWKTIATGATNNTSPQLIDTTTFSSTANGRYFRVLARDRWNTTYGHSIWEIGLYGTQSVSIALPGDANSDNKVNAIDLSILLSRDGQNYPPADFNKDGIVGAADMAILLGKWTW